MPDVWLMKSSAVPLSDELEDEAEDGKGKEGQGIEDELDDKEEEQEAQ